MADPVDDDADVPDHLMVMRRVSTTKKEPWESPLMKFYRQMKDDTPAVFAKELREAEKSHRLVMAAKVKANPQGEEVEDLGEVEASKLIDKLLKEIGG